MRGALPARLSLFLGFVVLLTLLGGPAGVSLSGLPASEAHEPTGPVGIAAPLSGGDAVLAAKPEARQGVWGQRVRPPRTIFAFMALAIGGAVPVIWRRRWRLVAGRPRLVATRRASGVRGPPLLQPA
jgi:hypothetical protein